MDTHRINIFHITDSNHVSRTVAHYFILYFLPSGNTALHQNLAHAGKPQAVFQNFRALFRIFCDSAAGTAQGIGRPEHHRIADLRGYSQAVRNAFHNLGGSHRLSDFFHGFLKHFPVLSFFYSKGCGSDETHAVFFKDSGLL